MIMAIMLMISIKFYYNNCMNNCQLFILNYINVYSNSDSYQSNINICIIIIHYSVGSYIITLNEKYRHVI